MNKKIIFVWITVLLVVLVLATAQVYLSGNTEEATVGILVGAAVLLLFFLTLVVVVHSIYSEITDLKDDEPEEETVDATKKPDEITIEELGDFPKDELGYVQRPPFIKKPEIEPEIVSFTRQEEIREEEQIQKRAIEVVKEKKSIGGEVIEPFEFKNYEESEADSMLKDLWETYGKEEKKEWVPVRDFVGKRKVDKGDSS